MMRRIGILRAAAFIACALVFNGFVFGQAKVAAIRNYATLDAYKAQTGKTIQKFNEAPALAALVKAGKLPPVEKRLPAEPLVVAPLDSVGKYGGSLRTSALGPTSGGNDSARSRQQNLFMYEADYKTIVPNIAKSWKFSEDLKSITITLRKGLRWSDGEPVSTSDVMFAYEDVLLNKELFPATPALLRPKGVMVKVFAVDDLTFRLEFASPYAPILPILAMEGDPLMYPMLLLPKHFYSKYHLKYNPKADEQAKAAGYPGWVQQFLYYKPILDTQQAVNVPTLQAWVLTRVDNSGNKYYERNPYYFKVDTNGNQLPYIDELVRVIVEDRQVRTLKILGGQIDVAAWDMPLSEWTLYKENEKAGNYTATLWPQAVGARTAYDFNYGSKDAFLRGLFNDLRFRQALSIGFDRRELNKVLAYGEAVPRQAAPLPITSFYEEWMGSHYAEYDPQKANKLLDEIGLKWDARQKYRLRPDGNPISFTIETQHQVFVDYSVIVKEYWEKLGFRIEIKLQQLALVQARRDAGDVDVSVQYMSESFEPIMFQDPGVYRIANPQLNASFKTFNDWAKWIESAGKEGLEPPADYKKQFDLASRWLQTEPGTPAYLALGKEMTSNYTQNLRAIGTLGMEPIPIMFKNGLANIPRKGTWQGGPFMLMPYQPDQWYWNR